MYFYKIYWGMLLEFNEEKCDITKQIVIIRMYSRNLEKVLEKSKNKNIYGKHLLC